ncbi:hypothetical protein AB0M28_33585 [Streptomyces sp. NPDC051940]|uniref:hypothetical protein n=1 Tax=Streptomyces sp. NPDC051940 TaxID=3155675 RepID=UPI00342BA31D
MTDPDRALPVALGPGRVVTYPDPDAYVLVDGVLVRVAVPGGLPGDEAVLAPDAGSGRPVVLGGNEGDGTG